MAFCTRVLCYSRVTKETCGLKKLLALSHFRYCFPYLTASSRYLSDLPAQSRVLLLLTSFLGMTSPSSLELTVKMFLLPWDFLAYWSEEIWDSSRSQRFSCSHWRWGTWRWGWLTLGWGYLCFREASVRRKGWGADRSLGVQKQLCVLLGHLGKGVKWMNGVARVASSHGMSELRRYWSHMCASAWESAFQKISE